MAYSEVQSVILIGPSVSQKLYTFTSYAADDMFFILWTPSSTDVDIRFRARVWFYSPAFTYRYREPIDIRFDSIKTLYNAGSEFNAGAPNRELWIRPLSQNIPRISAESPMTVNFQVRTS